MRRETKNVTRMSTAALQDVWKGLLAYNLSTANKRWLAERLWEQAAKDESAAVKPYTMEELNARIDRAEADIAAGRVYTQEEARRLRQEHFFKLVNA